MFYVTKEIEFDAAHRVPDHSSKCFNLHGHRYKVEATVAAPELQAAGSSTGMVVDFGDLKALLMKVHEAFDHRTIIYTGDPLRTDLSGMPGFVEFSSIPTAENLAGWIFHFLNSQIPWGFLHQVKVFETPTSVATFRSERVE